MSSNVRNKIEIVGMIYRKDLLATVYENVKKGDIENLIIGIRVIWTFL